MAMSIKNPEVEQLAEELSRLTRTSKTEIIRQSLLDKKRRLVAEGMETPAAREARLRAWLERFWATLPPGASKRLTKEEEEELLGYNEYGV